MRRAQRGRGARVWRALRWLVTITVVLVAGFALALAWTVRSDVDRVVIDGLTPLNGQAVNLLVLSADSVVVLRHDRETGAIDGVVVPDDLPMLVPGYGFATLETARADGDRDALVSTIARYTGLDIQRYAEIDIEPLREIAGAGGLESCRIAASTTEEQIVRDVITAQAAAERLRVRRSPLGLLEDVRGASRALTVDAGADLRDLIGLPRVLAAATSVTVVRVPTDASGQALPEQSASLFQALQTGTPLAAIHDDAEAPIDLAGQTVVVLNGTVEEGLAALAADALTGQQLDVVEVGNADAPDYAVTQVRHAPEQAEVAAALVTRLGAGTAVEDAEVETITVVLGRDWAAHREVLPPPTPEEQTPVTQISLPGACA